MFVLNIGSISVSRKSGISLYLLYLKKSVFSFRVIFCHNHGSRMIFITLKF